MFGKNVLSGWLTLLQSLLSAADIPYVIFDQHISSLEAGIGAFPPYYGAGAIYFPPVRARMRRPAL